MLPLLIVITWVVTNQKHYKNQGWDLTIGNCFNYIIGSLLGENVGAFWKLHGRGLRILLGVWIFASLILGASFSGQLRAFLLKGTYESPIDTAEDILNSGMTWDMKVYGEDIELDMATSYDADMRALWSGKHKVDMDHCGYEMVKMFIDCF